MSSPRRRSSGTRMRARCMSCRRPAARRGESRSARVFSTVRSPRRSSAGRPTEANRVPWLRQMSRRYSRRGRRRRGARAEHGAGRRDGVRWATDKAIGYAAPPIQRRADNSSDARRRFVYIRPNRPDRPVPLVDPAAPVRIAPTAHARGRVRHVERFTWSPSANRLAYASTITSGFLSPYTSRLFSVARGGGARTALVDRPA